MLTVRVNFDQAVQVLIKSHKLSHASALAVAKEAEARIVEHMQRAQPARRERTLASLNALHAKAFQNGNLSLCREVLRDIATIEGTLPLPGAKGAGLPMLPEQAGGGEFGQRTDAELDYFIKHECWPEEADESAAPAVVSNTDERVQAALPVESNGNGRRAFPV